VGIGDLYGVVVGVAKYQNSKVPKLKVSDKDAKDIADLLKTQRKLFRNIYVDVLVNEEATHVEVNKHLFHKLRRAGKDDTVVLYFSGHGADDPQNPGEYFFLTHDADPDFLEATAVNLSRMRFMERLDSKRVIVLADTCHAGGFSVMRTKAVEPAMAKLLSKFKESEGRVILTSSRPDQVSIERDDLQNSVFTHFLIQGLKGPGDLNGDGVVSVREIYDFVYESTKSLTGGVQHPQWEGRVTGTVPMTLLTVTNTKLTLVTEPAQVEVLRRTDTGFDVIGKTDDKGELTIEKIPIGKPLILMVKKPGWKDRILDPFVFTEEKPEIKSAVKLQPAVGFLVLKTNASKAKVKVGDRDVGETNEENFVLADNVQVGTPLEILIKKEGFEDKKITLTIPVEYEGRMYNWQEKLVSKGPSGLELVLSSDPPGVEVFIGDDKKPVGATDESGKLKFTIPPTKHLVLSFRKKGYSTSQREYDLPPEGTFLLGKIALEKVAPRLELAIGEAGAEVFVKHPESADKATPARADFASVGKVDPGGRVTVKDLPLGAPITIKVVKPGWREKIVGPFTLTEQEPVIKPPQIALEPAVATVALLTDRPGAKVKLGGVEVGQTDKDGKIVLKDVKIAAVQSIEALHEGYETQSVQVTVPAEYDGKTYTVPDTMRLAKKAPAPVEKAGGIDVMAYADQPGVKVYVGDKREYAGETDASGRVRLPLGAAGKKVVYFEKDYFETSKVEYDLKPDNAGSFPKAVLKRTRCDVRLSTVPGGVGVFEGNEYRGETCANGELTLKGIALDKPLNIKFSKSGFSPVERSVSLTPQAVVSVEQATLQPLVTKLEITVDQLYAEVFVKRDADFVFEGRIGPEGGFVVTDLPFGKRVFVKVKKDGWREKSLGPYVFSADKLEIKPDAVKLDMATASVKLAVEPSGATVKINGKELVASGSSVQIPGVQVATDYELVLSKEGYKEKRISLEVPADYDGRTYKMDTVKLEPITVTVELKTEPGGVTVRTPSGETIQSAADGKVVIEGVPVGVEQKLRFQKEGYEPKAASVVVPKDETGGTYASDMTVQLEKSSKPTRSAAAEGTRNRSNGESSPPPSPAPRAREVSVESMSPSSSSSSGSDSGSKKWDLPADFRN
jgi:hypothetical protein